MRRSTLPLVRGVYGRVRMWRTFMEAQRWLQALDRKGEPLSVITRSMRTFIRANQATALRRKEQAAWLRSSAKICEYERREASSVATKTNSKPCLLDPCERLRVM